MLAEIDAARQFAHDHDVETLDDIGLEARRRGQRRVAHRRAQIGEQAEILAKTQKAGFGTNIVGDRVPLRATDGAEDHGVRGLRQIHRRLRDRDLVRIIGRTADEAFFALEAGELFLVQPRDDVLDLGHHLGTDAVAGQKKKLVRRHDLSRCFGKPEIRADC
mgnify:CR=1 FL=1